MIKAKFGPARSGRCTIRSKINCGLEKVHSLCLSYFQVHGLVTYDPRKPAIYSEMRAFALLEQDSMADFAAAWPIVLSNEGGYSDNPADTGGATMFGVTEAVARAHGYTGDMHDLPLPLAMQIAKTGYWDPYSCDQLPQEVADQVLDTAYNGGHPAEWLQQAAGVTVDGQIGPQTIAAVNAADPDKITMMFNASRIDYLASLSIWPSFGRGWMHRIADNLRRAAS